MGALDRHSAAAFGLAPCRQVTLDVPAALRAAGMPR